MSAPFTTWPDLLIAGLMLLFAALAARRGFAAVLVSLLGFVAAFLIAFSLYANLAVQLSDRFNWSPVWARPLAFIGLWLLVETLFSIVGGLVTSRLRYTETGQRANRLLAIVPGALQGLIVAALVMTLLAVMPLAGEARNSIVKAPVGSRLVEATLALEGPLEGIFGEAARETLGFITIRPPTSDGEGSGEAIKLNFTVENAEPDPQTEEDMLALVNKERAERGLSTLEMDPELRLVARAHAEDMFERGYFAHNTPEGTDPFDRMRAANIIFGLAGENLALAPTLNMAHEGLMNSPGHRANILRDGFNKVGIGVLDGGIYGKMFVQEFSD
jgi:uncharacterized protein YkwD/uncharacterized membrane protein required for colicin V production